LRSRARPGYDPSDDGLHVRLDEMRWFTPRHGPFNFQIGKICDGLGNWVPRHGSWDNRS